MRNNNTRVIDRNWKKCFALFNLRNVNEREKKRKSIDISLGLSQCLF